MLDHAARRFCQTHSWVKRAEAARRQFLLNSDFPSTLPKAAIEVLDEYCEQREKETESDRKFLINRRALGGWKEIVQKWKRCIETEFPSYTTGEINNDLLTARLIEIARSVQEESQELETFGDIQLFERLAQIEFRDAWVTTVPTLEVHPSYVEDYAKVTKAKSDAQRFKVPTYRHPDELLHPIFVDFGESRWGIEYARHSSGIIDTDRLQKELELAKQKIEKASQSLDKAKSEEQKTKKRIDLEGARNKLKNLEQQTAFVASKSLARLDLWTGKDVSTILLNAASRRFEADFGRFAKHQPGDDRVIRCHVAIDLV